MALFILFKDILLDNNWFAICPDSIVNIFRNGRQLHAASGGSEVAIGQLLYRPNLVNFERAIGIEGVALLVGSLLRYFACFIAFASSASLRSALCLAWLSGWLCDFCGLLLGCCCGLL